MSHRLIPILAGLVFCLFQATATAPGANRHWPGDFFDPVRGGDPGRRLPQLPPDFTVPTQRLPFIVVYSNWETGTYHNGQRDPNSVEHWEKVYEPIGGEESIQNFHWGLPDPTRPPQAVADGPPVTVNPGDTWVESEPVPPYFITSYRFESGYDWDGTFLFADKIETVRDDAGKIDSEIRTPLTEDQYLAALIGVPPSTRYSLGKRTTWTWVSQNSPVWREIDQKRVSSPDPPERGWTFEDLTPVALKVPLFATLGPLGTGSAFFDGTHGYWTKGTITIEWDPDWSLTEAAKAQWLSRYQILTEDADRDKTGIQLQPMKQAQATALVFD